MQQPGELGDENPREPGEVLGFFSVEGTLADDSCGAESLSAPEKWSFDVKLSRDGSTLYWLNGREAIVGDIDAADRFGFETQVDVTVAAKRGAFKGCVMQRRDTAAGALRDGLSSFTGKLTYAYAEKSGSDCSEFETGADGMPAALPCELSYALEGARVSEE